MKFSSPGPWLQPTSHRESIYQNISPVSKQLANEKYIILPKLKIMATFGWAETSKLAEDRLFSYSHLCHNNRNILKKWKHL